MDASAATMVTTAGNTKLVGPFGGQGGNKWDDGPHPTVRKVVIHASKLIDSIQVEYDDDGKSRWGTRHGASTDGIKHQVALEFPEEFVIAISGHLNSHDSDAVLQSLTILTNKKKYGPYGVESGNDVKYFSTSPTYKGKILGFFGRSGTYVDSIGACLGPFSVGPVGGPGGDAWDDGTYNGVKQIIVHAAEVVDSVQIEYDHSGISKWSPIHGKTGGHKYIVTLDPNEYLVNISGYHGTWFTVHVVRSLTFETNRRSFGPFGPQRGEYFKLTSAGGNKILGFFGKSGDYVDSIGAHVF